MNEVMKYLFIIISCMFLFGCDARKELNTPVESYMKTKYANKCLYAGKIKSIRQIDGMTDGRYDARYIYIFETKYWRCCSSNRDLIYEINKGDDIWICVIDNQWVFKTKKMLYNHNLFDNIFSLVVFVEEDGEKKLKHINLITEEDWGKIFVTKEDK